MYNIVTGGYHDSGFMVSRFCFIAILNHILPSVYCKDADMIICVYME